MIVILSKRRLIESTGATYQEQDLATKSLIIQAAFMMFLVELLHLFLHLFFSAVQLNLQEGNIHVCVCEYCTVFSNVLQIKMQVIVLGTPFKSGSKITWKMHEQSRSSSMSSFKRAPARFYILLINRCLIELLSPLFLKSCKIF